MSDSGKLNFIWFKDQEPARRLRLRPGWMRALTYLLVLVVLLAAGGSYGAWEFWRRAQDVSAEKREVEKRLSETLIKLERLQNIEKLLQTSDASELSQLLAGMGIEPQAAKTPVAPPKQGKDTPKEKEQAKEQKEPPRQAPAGFDLAAVMGKVDVSQVGVENFKARTDAKGIQFTFDLSNLMPQSLSGSGQLAAVTRDGTLVALSAGKDELAFNIQRFKQVQAVAAVPQGIEASNLFGYRLTLSNASGKTIFSETFPLAQTQ